MKTSYAACITAIVAAVGSSPAFAHGIRKAEKATGVPPYHLTAGLAASHLWLNAAGVGTPANGWMLGPTVEAFVGWPIVDSPQPFHSGITLTSSVLFPVAPLTLGGTDLENAASVHVALLWTPEWVLLPGLALRTGVGPTLAHFAESSGYLLERTTFGAAEQVGVAFRLCGPRKDTLELAVTASFSQAFSGADDTAAAASLFSAGGTVTLGWRFDAGFRKAQAK